MFFHCQAILSLAFVPSVFDMIKIFTILCPVPHLQVKMLWPLPLSTTYELWHFDWPLSWPLPTLPSHLWTKVAPTVDSEMNKDLKSLSGGERSFSTVCFILSLWNAMESPFRCLDEFDVYMVSLEHCLWNPIESPFWCLDEFDVYMVSLEHGIPLNQPSDVWMSLMSIW